MNRPTLLADRRPFSLNRTRSHSLHNMVSRAPYISNYTYKSLEIRRRRISRAQATQESEPRKSERRTVYVYIAI